MKGQPTYYICKSTDISQIHLHSPLLMKVLYNNISCFLLLTRCLLSNLQIVTDGAHAKHISKYLCKYVWKSFHFQFLLLLTFSRKKLVSRTLLLLVHAKHIGEGVPWTQSKRTYHTQEFVASQHSHAHMSCEELTRVLSINTQLEYKSSKWLFPV